MSTTKPISSDIDATNELSGEFSSSLGRAIFQQKIESVLLSTKQATGADGVAVSLREGSAYVCQASVGDAPEIGVTVEPGQGICGRCIAESKAIVEQDLDGAIKSVAAVPVMREGKTYGFVAGFSQRPHAFPESIVEDFYRLAEVIHGQVEPIIPMSLNPEATEADDDLLAQLGIVPEPKRNVAEAEEDDSFLTELVRDVLQDAPSNKSLVAAEEAKAVELEEPQQSAAPMFPTRTTEEVLMQVVEHKPLKAPAKVRWATATAPAPAPIVPAPEQKAAPLEVQPAKTKGRRPRAEAWTAKEAEAVAQQEEVATEAPAAGQPWTWPRAAMVVALLAVVISGIWYYVRRQRVQNPEPQKVVAASPAKAPENSNPTPTPTNANSPASQPSKPVERLVSPEKKAAAKARQPLFIESNSGPARVNPGEDASPALNGVPVKLSAPVLPAGSTDIVFSGKRSTGAVAAKLLQRTEPAYPPMARSMHVAGKVTLELTVSADGRVKAVRQLEGNHMLANAAEAAVRRWRYQPAKQNGTNVESVVEVIFNFR